MARKKQSVEKTIATMANKQNFPIHKIALRLGHSKPGLTMDTYGHYIPNRQEEIIEYIDEFMTPVSFKENDSEQSKSSKELNIFAEFPSK